MKMEIGGVGLGGILDFALVHPAGVRKPRDGASATFSSGGIHRVTNLEPEAIDRAATRWHVDKRFGDEDRPRVMARQTVMLSTKQTTLFPMPDVSRKACL